MYLPFNGTRTLWRGNHVSCYCRKDLQCVGRFEPASHLSVTNLPVTNVTLSEPVAASLAERREDGKGLERRSRRLPRSPGGAQVRCAGERAVKVKPEGARSLPSGGGVKGGCPRRRQHGALWRRWIIRCYNLKIGNILRHCSWHSLGSFHSTLRREYFPRICR